MQYIDEKFKESSPQKTVERIQALLKNVGIVLEENCNNSGIENCWSCQVKVADGYPMFSNGKGVTRDLARASAYAEFIERLQCGLFLYKFQSIGRDKATDLHSFAPDGKYMTVAELEAEGDWMDYVIESYGHGLTRKKIAALCKVYADTDEDKIWTVPYYSLFEDKYVYLPAGYVEHIFATNGCCAGNTRDEAWVHALSEMMERNTALTRLLSGKAAPVIPDAVLSQFSTAWKIIETVRQSGSYDIQVFDLSPRKGFPVISTRIINKETQNYAVNIAADPVLEIAINRTLTEIFQGQDLKSFSSAHSSAILRHIDDIPFVYNSMNQLECGSALFTVDYFTEELGGGVSTTQFPDNSNKTNQELLEYMLDLYRDLGKPLYVRNYSFLGFDTYYFAVPGFSEMRGVLLTEPVSEYALGQQAAEAFRNPAAAGNGALAMMLNYYNRVKALLTRKLNIGFLTGLPLLGADTIVPLYAALSYAAWRLKQYSTANQYLKKLLPYTLVPKETRTYFSCVSMYLSLLSAGTPEEQIRIILGKFFRSEPVEALYQRLDNGGTPYDGYLLSCDLASCTSCPYHQGCTYHRLREIMTEVGKVYNTFSDGQRKETFAL